ncbi:MAG TPA: DUF2807 domain-containing protein [Anseongella sp.]|nr:DUF2807 domain-containing protein [Anseongella sp.]
MMKKYSYLLLACSMLATSCERDLLRGEGPVLTEKREVPAFERINSDGSTRIHISYADTFSVTVTAYASLLPHFQTRVNGGVLELGIRDAVSVRNDNSEVYITLPALEGLRLNGSGEGRISGPFPSLSSLLLEINGSGSIRGTAAGVDSLQAVITGSGSMHLEELPARAAGISISGSGDLRVSVSEELNVHISGSGRVYYRGDPSVSSEISGSGKVLKF